MASRLGMSRPTYYLKLKTDQEWTLKQLVDLNEMMHSISQDDILEVDCGKGTYQLEIKKIAKQKKKKALPT